MSHFYVSLPESRLFEVSDHIQLLGHAIQPCNSGQLVGGSYMFYVHPCLGKGSNVTIIFFRWVEIGKLSNDFMKGTLLTFTTNV